MANFIKVATLCAAESEGLLDAPGRVRSCSVHPYNRGRDPFPRFYANIRKHSDKFYTYYRMTMASFDHLLEVHLTTAIKLLQIKVITGRVVS